MIKLRKFYLLIECCFDFWGLSLRLNSPAGICCRFKEARPESKIPKKNLRIFLKPQGVQMNAPAVDHPLLASSGDKFLF